MKIQSYYSQSGTDLIDKYIESLTVDEQVDAYDVLMQLEKGNVNTLNIKKWEGKICEVYFYKHNRIFYVVVEDENIYLLHACRKQKNKTEKKDCKIIISRAKELSKLIDKLII
jgi:phage-related protein